MSVDRGEHTETATRAGEAEAVEAVARAIWRNVDEQRGYVCWVHALDSGPVRAARDAIAAAYPIIAAAVRAEERERCVAETRLDEFDDWTGR